MVAHKQFSVIFFLFCQQERNEHSIIELSFHFFSRKTFISLHPYQIEYFIGYESCDKTIDFQFGAIRMN